ncbi:alpha/beta hydrolase [Corynebacterium freneyi]|uniref:alpha/beta fold hydrolase n=1 Tax=Corynebacterium freneyi TaxID=134034 RepID=UPI00254DE4C4|nr:alpha/beta hydrolase [Corynebacterium freneyi]MDK8767240.1 alpha/beta hydrolase [Corynebacterium freneyi]
MTAAAPPEGGHGVRTRGDGPPVVLVMGRGHGGRVWELHQVPALVRAGYRVTVFDNRGSGVSAGHSIPFTLDDMVADLAGIIESEHGQPAFVVGTSLGARICQELALSRPDLVRGAVFAAGHARQTPAQLAMSRNSADADATLRAEHPEFAAAAEVSRNLSASTLLDDVACRDWMDIVRHAPAPGYGARLQAMVDDGRDRREAYGRITARCLALAYADDAVIPPAQVREVADSVPRCGYVELPRTGHWGYLERPEAFNALLLGFLRLGGG